MQKHGSLGEHSGRGHNTWSLERERVGWLPTVSLAKPEPGFRESPSLYDSKLRLVTREV